MSVRPFKRKTRLMNIYQCILFSTFFFSSFIAFPSIAQSQRSDVNSLESHNVTHPIDDAKDPVDMVGSIAFSLCDLEVSGRTRELQCAEIWVPENPRDAESKQIKLFIARIPAAQKSKKLRQPMLLLAGGPGQAASEAFLFFDKQQRRLASTRDLYIIDQRGTGKSSPLQCKQLQDDQYKFAVDEIKKQTQACLDSFDADVRFYTTTNTVHDLEQVREALDVEQWNIFGVSYGTRVASTYAQLFPGRVRTMVLDSAVPHEHVLGSEIAIESQEALDTLFDECESNRDCRNAFPHLKERFNAFIQQPYDYVQEINYEDINAGEIEKANFSKMDVLLFVRFSLYMAEYRSTLLFTLNEALVNNNLAPLLRAKKIVEGNLADAMAVGLHNSVMCSEEYPHMQADFDSLLSANEKTYLGDTLLQVIQAVCSVWPTSPEEMISKAVLVTAIPTLLLVGELDPITPPAYADIAASQLSNAKVLKLNGRGHSVAAFGCTPNILAKFVETASVDDLNIKCLERLNTLPLFINANGFSP